MKAEEIARRIWAEDEASKWLGMELEEVRAGYASCSIEFLRPAAMHDRLTAEAAEVAHAGRSRHYDVRVTNQKGELVALFRGKSAAVRGAWIE